MKSDLVTVGGPNGNKWLYPDLVGMENLTARWCAEIQLCTREFGDKRAKLWSFEVKKLLNSANVRQSYFQAVSNSSWANYAYLIAAEIEGTDTLRELRVLASLHGVGIMRLDTDNPSESQILIPARERPDVDWDTMNRLTNENPDFKSYLSLVRQFYQTNDPRPNDWDYPISTN